MELVMALNSMELGVCSASLRPFCSGNWQSASSNDVQNSFSRLNPFLKGIVAARASGYQFPARTVARASVRERIGRGSHFHSPNEVWKQLVHNPHRDLKKPTSTRELRAQGRFDPGSGGDGEEENGVVRTIVNLALAGGLTYLTVTGKLGWVFDAIISLWLLAVIVPVVGLVAFLWFAEREIIRGACPNCGNEFQVFEFTLKEGEQRCPYCSQPFKVENKQFVREGPSFSGREQYGGFNPFGFGQSNKEAPRKDSSGGSSGVVVDVEAEVRDRD